MHIQVRIEKSKLILVTVKAREQFMVKGLLHTVMIGTYFDPMPESGKDILEKYIILENVLDKFWHQSFINFIAAKSCFIFRCERLAGKCAEDLNREVDFDILNNPANKQAKPSI